MHTAEQGSVDLVQRDRIAENKNWSPLSYIKLNWASLFHHIFDMRPSSLVTGRLYFFFVYVAGKTAQKQSKICKVPYFGTWKWALLPNIGIEVTSFDFSNFEIYRALLQSVPLSAGHHIVLCPLSPRCQPTQSWQQKNLIYKPVAFGWMLIFELQMPLKKQSPPRMQHSDSQVRYSRSQNR